MSGIEERISTVLAVHEYRSGFDTNCACGEPGVWFWADYRAHVAAVLVAELGLTEELSNDIAGPEWARYRRYVTPCETIYHRLRDEERAE